uniref:Uncharacterized protein n=1 Tax=Cyprinodon variegatus TaxID=28743 RepID=A0A3Q2D853_CYPVA
AKAGVKDVRGSQEIKGQKKCQGEIQNGVKKQIRTGTGRFRGPEAKLNKNCSVFLQVYVGDDNDYLHLWVFQSFSTSTMEIGLKGVQQHHKWDDPLKPFDEN